MASYKVLKQRIKITVEQGYDEETGSRLRKFKTVTLNTYSHLTVKDKTKASDLFNEIS
ncbi:hypothetical protein HRF87_10235 [Bacillus sp. CRN 9]|nr:hypothetical protein [Bacillus sp. CRN 9]